MPRHAMIDLALAPPRVTRQDHHDGSFLLRSPEPLGEFAPSVGTWLRHWAERAPSRDFLVERLTDQSWRRISYGEATQIVRGLGQALLDRGASVEHPVMILSDNGIDNGLLQLACMEIGVPTVPISPAYSLMSSDFGKLLRIYDLVQPRLIFAEDGALFAKALNRLPLEGTGLVFSRNAPVEEKAIELPPAEFWRDLAETWASPAVDAAFSRTGPDTVAKILFTSGSTGEPKGVINTQRMLCSNQQAIVQCWPFLEEKPPVTVDWLPWHHTFGGNHNFNMILRNGGTLYVDTGKPVPHLVGRTIDNLKEISPSIYFNVPRGFDAILAAMEKDEALRDTFFHALEVVFYAGAALPQPLWRKLETLCRQSRDDLVFMASAWGSTETAPLATSVHFPIPAAGNIGLPAPGTELKFVPTGSKLEMRVRGPNVTPGYHRREDLTKAAFDEEGFYRIGDAGRLADDEDPAQGVIFDGRTAEDFKLTTGTWVNTGQLRLQAIAAEPRLIQDAVVTGHDRDDVGLLLFINAAGCRAMVAGASSDTPLDQLITDEAVRKAVADGLARHNEEHTASSSRFDRALLMSRPPDIDANEITDKGYVNQRAVLENRKHLVDELYSESGAVIRPQDGCT